MGQISPTAPSRLVANRGLRRMSPFLSWTCVRRGVAEWCADAIAALTVALVLVPQSMAYAWPRLGGDHAAHCPLDVVRSVTDASQLHLK